MNSNAYNSGNNSSAGGSGTMYERRITSGPSMHYGNHRGTVNKRNV